MMRVYPKNTMGNMTNDCTCGHCQLTHVRRESNTARVYKVQLPPLKTRKAQRQKTVAAPKVIYGYQIPVKRKSAVKKPVKNVVRSKPEYDAWYCSDADLNTIAHSNMQNYLSRFQPDTFEAATQTVISGRQLRLTRTPSEDKAVQFGVRDDKVQNASNARHHDRGDSVDRDTPVALPAVTNYEKAAGDFDMDGLPTGIVQSYWTQKSTEKSNSACGNPINRQPSSEKIIEMPPPDQMEVEADKFAPDRIDFFKPAKYRKHRTRANVDNFSRDLHSGEDRLADLLKLETFLPKDNKMTFQPKHKAVPKIPRKLLETSLKKEKEARKSLTAENRRLTQCISKAEQKVKELRSSLSELSNTIKEYRSRKGLPYDGKVEKLEKLVDALIKEFRASNSKEVKNVEVKANCVVVSPGRERQRKDWSSLSGVSSVSARTTDTSLTALKNELEKFFEDMREDTEKLIKEAKVHHVALTSRMGWTSTGTSYGSSSSLTG